MNYMRVWAVALMCTLAGTFQFGYSVSVFNIPIDILQQFINNSHLEQYGDGYDQSTLVRFWSMTASILTGGMLIGAVMFTKPALDRLGRRLSLCVMAVLFIFGNTIQALSYFTNRYQLLPTGKIINGIAAAFACILCPIFLTEISPYTIRGAVGSLSHVMFVLGTLSANILTLAFGTTKLWPWLLVFPMIFPIMLLVTMAFVPESPKFLYAKISKTDRVQAKILTEDSLQWYHGVNADIDLLEETVERETEMGQMTIWQVLKTPSYRRMLLLVIAIGVGDSFNGTFLFTSFIKKFADSMNFNWDAGKIMSFLMPTFDLVVGLPSMFLIDRWGRRPLLLIGLWGVTIFLCVMFISQLIVSSTGIPAFSYLTLIAILGQVCVCTIGEKVVWMLATEIFATQARPAVSSFQTSVMEIGNILTTYTFLPLWQSSGAWVFLMLIIPMALSSLYCTYACPETRQRHIADILEELYGQGGSVTDRDENTPLLGDEEEEKML